MIEQEKPLYSLISLESFKSLLAIDDREDKNSRSCLETATHTIEQYCMRKFLRKKYSEQIEYIGDLLLPLREYPVHRVLAVYVEKPHPCGFSTSEFAQTFGLSQTPAKALETAASMPPMAMGNWELLNPDFYSVLPDCGTDYDLPFRLVLSRAIQRYCGIYAIKAVYWAGYSKESIPPDLSSACLELASWNMNRYKGRRIGMTGIVRGSGKDGEHFEMSMPENVKQLLEPHRRKVI